MKTRFPVPPLLIIMKNNSAPFFKEKGSNLLYWSLVVILFLPIVILPPSFQPSDWTRSIVFRTIMATLIFLLLFKFFYKKELSFWVPKWKISFYLPFLILSAFFINLITATIFSQDIAFSIFGSPTRAGGMLNLLFFFIFSLMLAIFINKNQWEKLFRALFIVGSLVSLLAMVQYFNIFKNIFIAYEGGSTPSLLGNSTILAIYVLFLSFLSFVFFIQKQNKKEKMWYGALFLLFIFTIFITGSRAGYLGLLVGFLYFFLFYPVRNKSPETPADSLVNRISNGVYPYPQKLKLFKITAASMLLLSMMVIAVFNFFPQLGEKNNILKTITTRVSVERIAKDIFGTRLSVWKMTVRAIQDKPLLGWGPENFYIGFEKYYDPTPFSIPKLLWDRPHNVVLDVAISSGLISLLLYSMFWVTLFWKLNAAKHAQKEDANYADNMLKIHGVQAMFIGYLIVLFFNFDSFTTYLVSFFFIGYSFYLIPLQEEKIAILPPQNNFLQKKSLGVVGFGILILFAWFWNIQPLYLSEKISRAKNLAAQKYCKEAFAISNNENWGKSGIIRPYAILEYSEIIKNCTFIEPEKEVEYSKKMVSLLTIATQLQPTFSRTWLFMASFVNVLAARESASAQGSGETKENIENKNKLLEESMGYLKKTLQLSPKRQEVFAEMEKNYLIAENYQSMEALGNECILIDPRFGECYWYMGLAQIFLNKQEEGKKNIELTIKNGYTAPPYKQLAIAYMSQENWQEAITAYEKIPVYYDQIANAASHHATLAFLYQQSDNYTRASEEALKVFKLQPENPETVPFIKLLLEQRPNDPMLKSSLAFIYQQPGPEQEISKAIAIYQQLIDDYPKNVSYYWELEGIYHTLKKYDQIIAMYRQLINNYPERVDYYWKPARIYYELKEYDKAYSEVISIIKLFPKQKKWAEDFIKTLPKNYWENYINR